MSEEYLKRLKGLKKGDRVDLKYIGVIMKNLEITSADESCVIIENLFAISKETGEPCSPEDKRMFEIVGKDNM
jgi:hypothetical protein